MFFCQDYQAVLNVHNKSPERKTIHGRRHIIYINSTTISAFECFNQRIIFVMQRGEFSYSFAPIPSAKHYLGQNNQILNNER